MSAYSDSILNRVAAEWLPFHDEFQKRVGRAATIEDIIACDTPFSLSKRVADIAQHSLEFLIAVKAPPQVIYAFQATGWMPLPSALKRMPRHERNTYFAAMERYFELLGAPAIPAAAS